MFFSLFFYFFFPFIFIFQSAILSHLDDFVTYKAIS